MPVSFSEEAWRLGETLPALNLLMLSVITFFFLALYSYQGIFQGNIKSRTFQYIARIILAYLLTTAVVCVVLISIDKFPLLAEPIIALKRLIVISMPASMGAIIVDGFDKE